MRSRRGVWLALAAAIGLVAVGVVFLAENDPGTKVTAGVEAKTGEYAVPVGPRLNPGFVVAGGQAVVIGGRSDGDFLSPTSALELSTGRWRELPDVPWPPSAHAIAAADLDQSVVALAVACISEPSDDTPSDVDPIYECPQRFVAAQLDLEAGTWRNLDLPAEVSSSRGTPDLVGSFGTDAFFAVGEPNRRLIWRYRSDSGEWEPVTTPFRAWDSCVIGDTLAVLGADYLRDGKVSEKTELDGERGEVITVSPGDGWTSPRIATLSLSGGSDTWTVGTPGPPVLYTEAPPFVRCGESAVMVAPELSGGLAATQSFVFWLDRAAWSDELEAMVEEGSLLSPMYTAIGDTLILTTYADVDPGCVVFDLTTAAPIGFECSAAIQGRVQELESDGSNVVTYISADAADRVAVAAVNSTRCSMSFGLRISRNTPSTGTRRSSSPCCIRIEE